jgi:nucleoid-associated protein YgaU
MNKDYKIGLMIGLGLVIASSIWLATRPSLRIDQPVPFDKSSQHTSNQQRPESPEQDDYAANTIILNNDSDLKPNTQPVIPELEPEPQYDPEALKTTKFHFVRPGDSLSSIAKTYYGSTGDWEKIAKANNIDKPHNIKVGQKLIIPE